MKFAIGQRWISDNENELGLGIITEVNQRTVNLYFPAAEENRIYALAGAPLTRILFHAGDMLHHHEGWQAQVLYVLTEGALVSYQVKRTDNQQETRLKESEIAPHISFSRPLERLFNNQIDRSDHFALRYQALQHRQAQFQSPWRGLRGMRAGLIPHQLHIAQEVGQRIHPRVILADEVGLGKTIEAGMIIQQQLLAEKIERIIIIVPENLQHQWLVEMLRRFNLPFSLFDEERADDFAASAEEAARNPFDSENLIICSLDWLTANPKRATQLADSRFDMLVVDEAHHLLWSEQAPSAKYQLIEHLARQIPSVLLLTATPEQLGQASHFARLRLLDPDRFHHYPTFLLEQNQYQLIAKAVQSLLENRYLTHEDQQRLATLLSPVHQEQLEKLNATDKEQRHQATQQIVRHLIDQHGTGRILFRNTRQSVKGFPSRIYHPILLEESGQEAKVSWLIHHLKSQPYEKALLLCRQTDTCIRLGRILREKAGIRTVLFHEEMTIIERDRAAAYFAETECGAQVLLSSAIGCEGRNFQFVNRLILFDLPEHPDLLEQSIGRLDRIGQTQHIHIYVPCSAQSHERRLARWYHEGLDAFEHSCPMGALLFEKCGQILQHFLQYPTDEEAFEAFLQDTRTQCLRLKKELEQGRDRLLEFNSHGGEQARRLADAIKQEEKDDSLRNFASTLFDVIGVEQEDDGEHSIIITPNATMSLPDFPGLQAEGMTVTFDRQLALAREELQFLTWDHPMIRNGIDFILSDGFGNNTVALLIDNQLPPGTLFIEWIYIIENQAAKTLQLTRFLPPTPIRILTDSKGSDLTQQMPFDTLEKQLKPLNKATAAKIVKMLRPNIERMLTLNEKRIVAKTQSIIQQAQQKAQHTLDAELHRLTALSAVNKNIRPDEINTLLQIRRHAMNELAKAGRRLDSLRIIVSNKG